MRIRKEGKRVEQEKNWYRILEISERATEQEIKAAYRKLAKKYHPDTHLNDKSYVDKFNDISAAYQILGDADKKKEYDRNRGQQKHQESMEHGQEVKPEQNTAFDFNFNNMNKNFESFFGFNPETKDITKEDKMKMKKNPLDTTDMFERFMGIKR